MRVYLWSTWADIHAAHVDPFTHGEIHGHLWRVRGCVVQDLDNPLDVRVLNAQCRDFALSLDHRNLGAVNTETIAQRAMRLYPSWHSVEVEEVGVCSVVMEAGQ